jgi:diguanylate cyclase (GGDEF)-like protein
VFEGRKRQFFLVGLSIGLVFITLNLLVSYVIGRVSEHLPSLVILSLILLGLLIVLWRKPKLQRRVEFITIVVSSLYLLYSFYLDLAQAQNGFALSITAEVLQNVQWLMVVYLASFIIFSLEWSLQLSTVIYFVSLAIGLAFLLPRWLAGYIPEGSYSLFLFYVANATILLFLYRIGSLRQQYALVDFLTGLSNRRHLYELLQHEAERSRRYHQPLSVILFDVDHFKTINDLYGHLSGDLVLKEIARLIVEKLRTVDEVGRWGGEEFLILLPETKLSGAQLLAERLREILVEHKFESVGQVTASFGVTEYQPGDTPETLIYRADVALYDAKREGRNRVAVGALQAVAT